MDSKDMVMKMAAVLSAIYDMDQERPGVPIPASPVYMALGHNRHEYEMVTGALHRIGWIVKTDNTLTITEDGRKKAQKIEEAMKKIIAEPEARIYPAHGDKSRLQPKSVKASWAAKGNWPMRLHVDGVLYHHTNKVGVSNRDGDPCAEYEEANNPGHRIWYFRNGTISED